jgi:hypothetical protein
MDSMKKSPPSPRQRNATKSQGILVLGMHRSGTSACTRLLNLLGCALAEEVYGAAEGNENGHWESVAAVTLNDEILNSAGSRWDDWGPINADWRESSLRTEMTARAAEVIRDHARLGPLFALKDPRLCRLADVWLDAMEDAKVEPLVLTMLRNPVEVTQSLENRDLMAQGYGSLLWLRHVLDAEYLSRGRRRLYVNYDQLLDNWPTVIDRIKAGFGVSFPRNSPAVHEEIDTFLTRKHQHHQQPAEAVNKAHASSDWLRRAWAIFLSWSEHGEDSADHEALDAIRREFDRSYGTFARLLMHNDLSGEYAAASQLRNQLSATIAEAEQAAAQAAAAMQEADSKLQAQSDHEVTLRAELAAAVQKSAALEAELEVLRASEPGLTAEIAALQASLTQAGDKIGTLEQAIAQLEAETAHVAALEAELETLRASEPALTAEIAALQASLTQAGDKVGTLEQAIAQLEAETAQVAALEAELETLRAKERELAANLAEAREALRRAQGDAETERDRRLQTEQMLAAKDAAFITATEQSAQYFGQLSVAQSTLAQRAEEIAQMSSELLTANGLVAAAEAASTAERERREAAEQQISELQAKLDQNSAANAVAADKLAAEVSLMAQLLRDENKALSNAQSALASATQELALSRQENAGLEHRLDNESKALASAQSALASAAQELALSRQEHASLEQRLDNESKALASAQSALASATQGLALSRQENASLAQRLDNESKALSSAQSALASATQELALNRQENAGLAQRLRELEQSITLAQAEKSDTQTQLSKQLEDIAQLTKMLAAEAQRVSQAEMQAQAAQNALNARTSQEASLAEKIRQVELKASSAEASRLEAERKLANRFSEVARLTAMLSQEAVRAEAAEAKKNWLSEVARVSRSFPKWWALMPTGWRRKREYERYSRHDLFDAEQYFALNSDVAQSGMDALTHYMLHGLEEGRRWRA